jgi:hypothetical protein
LTKQQEKMIIDMRQASVQDLVSLSRLLFNVSSVLSYQGIKLQIKKTATYSSPFKTQQLDFSSK